MSFWILTDAAADIPQRIASQYDHFEVLPMTYQIDGKEYTWSAESADDMSQVHGFYQQLRDGKVSSTAQISLFTYQTAFEKIVAGGEDVLYIAFSSGLSGTYQAAVMAQRMVMDEHPGSRIMVVDGLSASVGHGLLVEYALAQRAQGKGMEETAQWVLNNRQRLIHWFTVDDLMFLLRGGRVSKTSAYLGSMLKIKPILHVNFEGKLIPVEKASGRKRSIKELAEKTAETIDRSEPPQTILIGHGDCAEDAAYLIEQLRKEGVPFKDVQVRPIGAIIGSHSGPGTLAIFFLGTAR